MDGLSSRKPNAALSFSRKVSPGLALMNSHEKGDRTSRVCSRVGCGSKIHSSSSKEAGCSGKTKTTRSPVGLSTSGIEAVTSSSKTPVAQTNTKKPISDTRKMLPSHRVTVLETRRTPNNSEFKLAKLVQNNVSEEASSSSSTPRSRDGKRTMRMPELGKRVSSIGSSSSPESKQVKNGVSNGAGTSKYNLKNLNCNSVNDAVSSGCLASLPSASSSDLSLDRNRVMRRTSIGQAECSSQTRGKKVIDPVVADRRNEMSSRGISITSSTRTRSVTSIRDNDHNKPVGIRRSAARAALHEQDERNRSRQGVSRRPGTSSSNNNSIGSFATSGSGADLSFLNGENMDHYLLLALDGIEQDLQPSYERMLSVEANFLLNSLSSHDQHRDMRMDIDSMSYEELLALGERIGTVSTALTEEALEKCLKKSIYQATPTEEGALVGEPDYIKCCICQEEYVEGSKVGRLGCEHQYHVECIQKWLQVKNWCPICKANAAPSPSSSP